MLLRLNSCMLVYSYPLCFLEVKYSISAERPIRAVSEFVAQLSILELLDNVSLSNFYFFLSFVMTFFSVFLSRSFSPIKCVSVVGHFYCRLQGCLAHSCCCWGMRDCGADTANWPKDQKTYEEEGSLCEEWCFCCVPYSGLFTIKYITLLLVASLM